ncbi:hypothetical protein Hamer_G020887 [Homarus americanus]|uniref:Uncharacterized protein n=1 Tax=Homarus americanus TaxID=6706 RepID=A0A8J5K1Q8_HOMAM|nr:hypothetical protein Hamer_G020887 [Homarus americanus]
MCTVTAAVKCPTTTSFSTLAWPRASPRFLGLLPTIPPTLRMPQPGPPCPIGSPRGESHRDKCHRPCGTPSAHHACHFSAPPRASVRVWRSHEDEDSIYEEVGFQYLTSPDLDVLGRHPGIDNGSLQNSTASGENLASASATGFLGSDTVVFPNAVFPQKQPRSSAYTGVSTARVASCSLGARGRGL